MTNEVAFKVAVIPGDGIGIEVTRAAVAVLRAAEAKVGGFRLEMEELPGGALCYRDTGESMSADSWAKAEAADAILLGAMGWPEIRYPDGTEIAPQVDMRVRFELYAGVRPIKVLPGGPCALADPRARGIDFVLIRESTEGLFHSRGKGTVENDQVARDTMQITRATSERLFDFGFELARQRRAAGRKGKLTLVDKANVFRSFAFMRKVFDERAQANVDIASERLYVDACALDFVRRPWDFDVLVTENMFGDILSDLAGGLIGGMGFAPSADIGDGHAVFQPSHGTAPDIAGTGRANPTAMLLSAAMMLEWLGQRHDVHACQNAGRRIDQAVARAFAEGRIRTYDMGGSSGTDAVAEAICTMIQDG